METQGNTFVVGIDFWGPSTNALATAVKFAQMLDANVIALHVKENNSHSHYPETMDIDRNEPEEDLEIELEKLVDPFRKTGVKIESMLLIGNVTFNLLEVCEENSVDLIFMGIREGRLLEDIFIGENTMHLVRNEDYPLVVVDLPPEETPLQEMMIPFDRKVGIEGVLQFLKGLKQPMTRKALMITSLTPDESEAEVLAAVNKAADQVIETGIRDIEIEIVKDADARDAVITQVLADRGMFDLVLLEHIDYSEAGRMTAGSLIEEIVTKCRMPVLCLPKTKTAE